MKRLSAAAVLLALCLFASPAYALGYTKDLLRPIRASQPEGTRIYVPTGWALTIPPAPYDAVWNSFYSARDEVNWGRFSSADNSAAEIAFLDRATAFHVWEIPVETHEDLRKLVAQLRGGTSMKSLLQPYGRYNAGAFLGAIEVDSRTGIPKAEWMFSYLAESDEWGFGLGAGEFILLSDVYEKGGDACYALPFDNAFLEQLDASGLVLPNTAAYSIVLGHYGNIILFDDGIRQFVRPQNWLYRHPLADTAVSENAPPTGDTLWDQGPSVDPSLPPGQLYPLDVFLADLENMARNDWLIEWGNGYKPPTTGKPVIYLYPEKETEVSVKLRFQGDLTYTYPAYGDGWNVTAHPDGRIVNKADRSEHYYLFWEGVSDGDWTFDQGFCVKGTDTEAFLREKLTLLGLTPREYNDFITYWVPKMQGSPYNLIKFADTEYDKLASLTVTPKPDILARIHMVYQPLEKPVEIPPQTLSGFERKGFTVVEWGGTEAGRKSITK